MRNENKEIIKQRILHSFDRWQEHIDASDIVQSVNDAQQALEAAQKIHNISLEAEANYLMGQSHFLLNNYDMTLKLVQKALRLHESIGCTLYLAEDWNVLGIVYSKIHEMDKAIQCYKMSIRYNPDTPRPYNNLAQHLIEKKQLLESLKVSRNAIRKALELSRRETASKKVKHRVKTDNTAVAINNSKSIVIAQMNIARAFKEAKKPAYALRHIIKAKQLLPEIDYGLHLAIEIDLAEVYLELNQYKRALNLLLDLLPVAEQFPNKEHLWNTFNMLCNVYKSMGDYQNALEYKERYIELYNKTVHDDMRDKITQLQTMFELENEQLKTKQLAERASKFASIAVMAAGITHEINQPLSAIKVTADSMVLWHEANPYTIPKRFDSRMQSISDAVERIHEIVQHMRAFWTDTSEAEPTAVNPYDVVQTTVGLFQKQMLAHLITLDVAIQKETPAIRINRLHLEQICINLLSNAIDALDGVNKPDKRICITLTHTQESVCLQIRDNATGIPDFLEPNQLFDPFYSTKTEGKGMGLGLAIVKSFVQKYQGTITAANNTDGGLTFDVTFPRYKEIL